MGTPEGPDARLRPSLGGVAVPQQIFRRDVGRGYESVVPFLHDLDSVVLHRHLEHCDQVAFGELGEDGTANQVGKSVAAPKEILLRLFHGQLVAASFSLNGQYELPPDAVDRDVYLVYLDLADILDGSPEVVLERIGGDAQEDVERRL